MSAFEEYNHFFTVSLELFDGPIDLLLHLVKQQELPIEKVSLAAVTEQYLACIEAATKSGSVELDLDIAGEYLVIAATLISIKASVLLDEPAEIVLDSEGNVVDPHEELLRRLRDAEVYKEGAQHLNGRAYLGLDVFAPPSALKRVPAPPVTYMEHSPMLLGKAFRKLIEQLDEKSRAYSVTVDSVSVIERMLSAIEMLKRAGGQLAFEALVTEVDNKGALVGMFIALLELCKRQIIVVQQEQNFDQINIVLTVEEVNLSGLHSEFDEPEEAAGQFSDEQLPEDQTATG